MSSARHSARHTVNAQCTSAIALFAAVAILCFRERPLARQVLGGTLRFETPRAGMNKLGE